ncbi:MAG: S8 family serine peptidase, partial [Candidatus Neomarinimicrobiota bacterium]
MTGTGTRDGKIHPASYTMGLRDDGRLLAWVYFTTKPPSGLPKSAVPTSSSRSALRRARRSALDARERRRLDQTVAPAFIKQVEATGATVRRVSRWLNAVSVRATPAQLRATADYDFVDRIEPVRRHIRRPLPGTGGVEPGTAHQRGAHQLDYGNSLGQLELMNVPAVHDLGYSGSGVWVLMLDTGFYQDHEAVNPQRILAQYDFLEDDGQTQNETEAEANAGQHNHGTYTYTTLGGYREGQLIGPAFACSYLLAKTESGTMEFQGEEDNYVAALEWGEALGADVVSSSLGYLDWYTYADLDGLTAVTTLGVKWATRLGMVVVTAAGNERGNSAWDGFIIVPGDADSIITVGAISVAGNLASFSSHGPTFDG